MIRNYFLTAIRNLGRNKTNTVINILGLAIAFLCVTLLFLTVHYEFSFDRFQANKDRLFKLYSVSHGPDGEETSTSMAYPMAPTLKKEMPVMEKVSSVMYGGEGISYRDKEVEKGIILVDQDFTGMFSFPILQGNKANPLADLNSVVISGSTRDAVFGSEDPIGKRVRLHIGGQWEEMTVTAVMADAPDNSSMRFNILTRIENNPGYAKSKDYWDWENHSVYVQLAPGMTQAQTETLLRSFIKKYHLVDEKTMKAKGYLADANGDMRALKLAPLTELHYDSSLGMGAVVSKTYLYTLIAIAIMVMVIACFNFVNLNVARAFTRAREVGVRKTLGAGARQIFVQLWTESLLLFLLALAIGLLGASVAIRPFNDMFTEKLKLATLLEPGVLGILAGGVLLVSLLAGGYPAWLISRFNATEVLKGRVAVNRSSGLRSAILTLQFVMAGLLISGTIVIYSQYQHLRNAPLGIRQESVISIPLKKGENAHSIIAQLRQRLSTSPQVESITGSSVNIGLGEDHGYTVNGIGFDYNGKSIFTYTVHVDYDYLRTLGITPVEGRDFSQQFLADTSSRTIDVVVTQSMASQFSNKSVLGLAFYPDSAGPKWRIVGVIPDFHLYSMNEKVHPLTMIMNGKDALGYVLVKVKTANPGQTMAMVRSAYDGIEPDNPVNPSYITDNINRWYEKEQKLSSIFCTAAVIAILLSCMGLFAIVSLVMAQRRREIGIRKVLGASVPEITGILSRDFLKLVLLGFCISTPIAWYFLHGWLEDFIYRITIGWWVFPLAGIITLLIALAAVGLQTIRASLADPVKSLRSE